MSMDLVNMPPEQKQMIEDGMCGRKKRNWASHDDMFCRHTAGKRTDHPGIGACWLHGGRAPIRSGRYSDVAREKLAQLIAEHREDPAILDTREDIAAVRALIEDYINRYDQFSEALIAWHESYAPGMPHAQMLNALEDMLSSHRAFMGDEDLKNDVKYHTLMNWLKANRAANPKPRMILDIADATRMLDQVTKMVERIHKLNLQQAISRKEFTRILQEIGNIIELEVKDDKTKARIRQRIGSMKLA